MSSSGKLIRQALGGGGCGDGGGSSGGRGGRPQADGRQKEAL